MEKYKIKKGLDIPLAGAPEQKITEEKFTTRYAIVGDDYVGMKPTIIKKEGDSVKKGEALFTAKKFPSVNFTSPVSGKVVAVNRGAKRKFLSMIIEKEGNDEVTFDSFSLDQIKSLDKEKAMSEVLASGLWVAFKTRPFSKIANPETVPHSIFINMMDTNPHAPSMTKVLEGKEEFFRAGVAVVEKFTDGNINIVKSPKDNFTIEENEKIKGFEFSGPHPAGLPGTHIHFIDPVGANKTVWYIDAEDVAAIGALFLTGKLDTSRVISIAGPMAKNPRLIKTSLGANVSELVSGEADLSSDVKVISGSVLNGRIAENEVEYLGRFHKQISILKEDREKHLLGWAIPTPKLFSVKNILLSALTPKKKYNLTMALNGGKRAIVPIGTYEAVMPLDILPTFLLRMLAVGDVEESEKLGALELDEEDLALCTFVCQSKIEHGVNLRNLLTTIEKEG